MSTLEAVGQKVDDVKEMMIKGFADIVTRQDTTNGRVSKLEKFMWICIGFCVCVSAIESMSYVRTLVTTPSVLAN